MRGVIEDKNSRLVRGAGLGALSLLESPGKGPDGPGLGGGAGPGARGPSGRWAAPFLGTSVQPSAPFLPGSPHLPPRATPAVAFPFRVASPTSREHHPLRQHPWDPGLSSWALQAATFGAETCANTTAWPSQHPGTQDVPQMPGRPRPALGHTDLWLSLERRVRAPCGQDRLRHCPLSSRLHVIVTFDLSQQPIGQGLGGRACGAGGKGPCPRRPLTKYRNSRGGGLRRRGCGGRVWRRRQGPPSSPGSVSFYFYSPDSGHILDGLRRGDGRDGVAPGTQPRPSLGQAAVGSQTGAPTPPVQLPPAPHGVWGVGTLPQAHPRPPSEHAARRPRDRRGEQGSGRPQPGLCPVCAPLSGQAWLSRGCCWGTGQTCERRNSPNRISTADGPAGSPPATGAVPLPSAWEPPSGGPDPEILSPRGQTQRAAQGGPRHVPVEPGRSVHRTPDGTIRPADTFPGPLMVPSLAGKATSSDGPDPRIRETETRRGVRAGRHLLPDPRAPGKGGAPTVGSARCAGPG